MRGKRRLPVIHNQWSTGMKATHPLLASCVALLLGTGFAYAGPCNTADKDAGSGPTPGSTAQSTTTGIAPQTNAHPPTATMDKASGNVATSSQDAQRQMQGQPTVSQESQGAKPKAGNDC
jgi:hypothetical protein